MEVGVSDDRAGGDREEGGEEPGVGEMPTALAEVKSRRPGGAEAEKMKQGPGGGPNVRKQCIHAIVQGGVKRQVAGGESILDSRGRLAAGDAIRMPNRRFSSVGANWRGESSENGWRGMLARPAR